MADIENFNIEEAVIKHTEKKGYAYGVDYYLQMVLGNPVVKHSEYYELVKKFDESLTDLINKESSTALVELVDMFPGFYKDGELPGIFVSEGLKVAFDNMSEYLMHLKQLYDLDNIL